MYELIGQFPVNFTDYDNIHQSNVETVEVVSDLFRPINVHVWLSRESKVFLKVMRLSL